MTESEYLANGGSHVPDLDMKALFLESAAMAETDLDDETDKQIGELIGLLVAISRQPDAKEKLDFLHTRMESMKQQEVA
jgi:hypothetical protein